MDNLNKDIIIHNLMENIPNHVKENYPNFHMFVKDFYKFLDQDGNILDILTRMRENSTLSLSDNDNLDKYLESCGFDAFDKVKNKYQFALFLFDFYASAGSPQSFRYLFRSLFGVDVRIEYPREQMLVPSSAEYYSNYFIFTSSTNLNSNEYRYIKENLNTSSALAVGQSSKLEALIESIDVIYTSKGTFLKIGIYPPKFEFSLNEFINISLGGVTFRENIKNVLNIDIIDGGTEYTLNDQIIISGSSVVGDASIQSLSKGHIIDVEYDNPKAIDGDIILAKTSNGEGGGFVAKFEKGRLNIYDGGYGYVEKPKLYIKSKQWIDDIKPIVKNVGGIQSIIFNKPFVDYDTNDIKINIITDHGNGFEYAITSSTIYVESGYNNKIGFLNQTSYLTDSYKYQQFSYLVISEAMPTEYYNIVREYLHPSGYIFFPVLEISFQSNLDFLFKTVYIGNEKVEEYTFEQALDFLLFTTFIQISLTLFPNIEPSKMMGVYNNNLEWMKFDDGFDVGIELLGEDNTIDDIYSKKYKSIDLNYTHRPVVEIINE